MKNYENLAKGCYYSLGFTNYVIPCVLVQYSSRFNVSKQNIHQAYAHLPEPARYAL